MPLTMVSLAFNLVIGTAFWLSELSVVWKGIITVLLVAKFLICFYAVFVAEPTFARDFALGICGLLNLCGAVYALFQGVWVAAVMLIALLVLLIGWRVLPTIHFLRKAGE